MDLREQEYVVTLAKHGSITKAADELFITQPTLSIFISRLEERMGVRLFDRVGKRFIPTYAGEIYLKKARQMLVLEHQFHAQLSDLIAGYTGRLRLGIHSRRSTYLLPTVLTEFHSRYPQIEVILTENNSKVMEDMVLSGDLDLVITNRFFDKDKLEIVPIYQDRLILSVPADHPACQTAKEIQGHVFPWIDVTLLKEERFILQAPAQSIRSFTDSALSQAGVIPKKTFIIENMETAAQMTAEGYGVSFNYESYIKYFHYDKPIASFEFSSSDFSFPIAVVYRKGSYLSAYFTDFIALVKEQINR